MGNFNELFKDAHCAVAATEDMRRQYHSAATHRDKALLKALYSVSSTKEALQVYKLSGNRVLKWLALDKAVQALGTELCDLEDFNALPREIGVNVSWGEDEWLILELKRTGTISSGDEENAYRAGSTWLCEFAYSLKEEKQRKLGLIGEKITSFELLLEYWTLLPKRIRYHVRDSLIKAVPSARELRSVRDKFKKSRIWPRYGSIYERCLHQLENES